MVRRIGFDLERELAERLRDLPHGTRTALFRAAALLMIAVWERHNHAGLGMLLTLMERKQIDVQNLNALTEWAEKEEA
jgi:hypothetical protein